MLFKVQLDCGCCFETIEFSTKEDAQNELYRVGLGNNKTIIDSTGKTITGVDTFYGVLDIEENTDYPLARLVTSLFG
jgi:hypothetical protein